MIFYKVTDARITEFKDVHRRRRAENASAGVPSDHIGHNVTREMLEVVGLLGEEAVARYLKEPWTPVVLSGAAKKPKYDILTREGVKVEVKTRSSSRYRDLVVDPDDVEGTWDVVVLCTPVPESKYRSVEIVGWLTLDEYRERRARRPERGPGWWVDEELLNPPITLLWWLGRSVAA